MLLRNQPTAPLETIYEESGSFVASNTDFEHKLYNHASKNETINCLISSRSTPSIDIQRQRINGNQAKPPIEVRYRDGSKRFIHSSAAFPMIINRKQLLDSSPDNLSLNKISNSNYHQIRSTNFPKKHLQSKAPLVITIITADDLNQAGITPTISSSSDDSEILTLAHSPSKSSINTNKSIQSNRQDFLEKLTSPSVQRVPSTTTLRLHSPVIHFQQSQNIVNHRPSSISSQTSLPTINESFGTSTQAFSIPRQKRLNSPLKVTVINDEIKQNSTSNYNLPNSNSSAKQLPNKIVNPTNRQQTLLLPGSRNDSAFRPFTRLTRFNDQTNPNQPQLTTNAIRRPTSSPALPASSNSQLAQQKQTTLPSLNLTKISLQQPPKKFNSLVAQNTYDPMLLKQKVSDTKANNNPLIQINSSNNQKQSFPISVATINYKDNTLTLPRLLNIADNSGQNVSLGIKPNTKWSNLTLNLVNDIPRQSSKYSRIPLHINLPFSNPRYNQNLVTKHDVALENRLLNAGLSPETVALYERILNFAEDPQLSKLSSSIIINPYTNKNFI
ncbi:unnamed protein product [Rotaria socialis]|uniref:Uncharacterized protein n=1 Tax=Rotaria socialis TaxID=392032 RepID=A0A820SWK8_9BILA|nr:unnamed protein product [Rotaria socialis]CAF4456582.1 unnamed protein product [Rotaria socialis]